MHYTNVHLLRTSLSVSCLISMWSMVGLFYFAHLWLMTLLMSTIHNWLVTLDKQISPICLVAVWTLVSEVSRFLACCLLVIFTTMFVSHDFNEYWYLKSLAFHNLADMLLCPVRNQTMESWHMWLITSNKLIFLTLVWSSDVCCFAD